MNNTEVNLIGCALMDNTIPEAVRIDPKEFSNQECGIIWDAMKKHCDQDKAYNAVTISEYLFEKTNQDWLQVVVSMTTSTLTSGIDHALLCAEKIKENFRKQQACNICENLINQIQNGEDLESINDCIAKLMDIDSTDANYDHTLKDGVRQAVDDIDDAASKNGLTGIPTGLSELDSNLSGLQKQALYIIGARPSMGKTALMLNIALAGNVPVTIISGEQAYNKIAMRCLAILGRVNNQRMQFGELRDEDWLNLNSAIAKLPDNFFIYDEPNPNINEVVAIARQHKSRYNIQALFVDYLQYIQGSKKDSKVEQVGGVTNQLKKIARDLDIPVVALAQVSRDVEKRPDKRPYPRDLSDASEIEKTADTIMMIYRDEVYNPQTLTPNVAEINIAKNRDGNTGVVRTLYQGQFFRFTDLAPQAMDFGMEDQF